MTDTNENSNFDPSSRPTYSQTQLDAYLDRIKLPAEHRLSLTRAIPISTTTYQRTAQLLALLTALIQHQLCAIPFEIFDLHYHPASMSPSTMIMCSTKSSAVVVDVVDGASRITYCLPRCSGRWAMM